jgi:hypothetical protein
VEFALFVPLFLLLLFSMLDFGFALYTNLTLDYASREGARVGAALATGNSALPCAQVDGHVIAAVQRVLKSAGIGVPLNNGGNTAKTGVNWIRIYNATAPAYADGSGYAVTGNYNEWTYSAGGGPLVDGTTLDFVGPVTPSWSACSRANGATPDELGVAISYTYAWQTPLVGIIKVATRGSFTANLTFLNKTVMNLNPTYP